MNKTPAFRVGDAVRVREQRWRVSAVSAPGDAHVIVTLAGAGPENGGTTLSVVTPFDRVEPTRSRGRLRRVGLSRWCRAWHSLLDERARHETHAALRSAAGAQIDLLPHQLEPAIALLQGAGSRVLIADEVGLGKTIEAALIVSELRARGAAERVLVLAPAALCVQWAAELEARFGLPAVVMDTREGRRRAAALPPSVNPWLTVPIAVASIDYVKRPEVLDSVGAVRWDVAIVDEAHGAAGASERRHAAETICTRAAHVLLLTATPHNGDAGAFESLLRLGATDECDSPLIFRRTRQDVALGVERRLHCLPVEPSAGERAMFEAVDLLERAVARLRGPQQSDAHLALAVLKKRAISSAHSLADSVARRLALLAEPAGAADAAGTVCAMDAALQLALPLASADEETDPADAPPALLAPLLDNRDLERHLLRAAWDAAAAAVQHESKLRVLAKLLRRLARRGERAIVFTEFRDTLLHVRGSLQLPSLAIHGGMTAGERQAAVHAFTNGESSVLLATDAAGEGLNLQSACRVVINLELPWSPVRLEQRIGRVDRIGQRRRVHIFHLVSRGTYEAQVLERLHHRLRAARADLVVADPLGLAQQDDTAPRWRGLRLAAEAQAEHGRLVRQRLHGGALRKSPFVAGDEILVLGCRRWRLRAVLSDRSIVILQAVLQGATGARCAIHLVPLAMSGRSVHGRRSALRSLLTEIDELDVGAFQLSGWQSAIEEHHRAFWSRRLAREHDIALLLKNSAAPLLQSGLFDRRAERELAQRSLSRSSMERECADRIRALERASTLDLQRPRPVLVLFR